MAKLGCNNVCLLCVLQEAKMDRKWDAVYQFHPVEKIANKIVIEKYVQLTEKGYCTLVSHLPTPLLESKHVGQDMHA